MSFTKRFYITGTSRGIGKSLAEIILKDEKSEVVGISRGSSIEAPNYRHVSLDLSDLGAVSAFVFGEQSGLDEVYLINNAGYLGEVATVGGRSAEDIVRSFNVNTTAPAILMNRFLAELENFSGKRAVLNVSSGAGRKSYQSWATYCAGKAALDSYSQVADDEQAGTENPIRVFSVAPGVVDTEMQAEVRAARAKSFPQKERFVDLKAKGELSDPNVVAEGLLEILQNPQNYPQCILDLRELGIR